MDRLITTAWRAFWVGLGVSAVLISQAVLSPSPSPVPADNAAAPLEPPRPHQSPAAALQPRCEPFAAVTGC